MQEKEHISKIQKITAFLRRHIRHLYYYVPPCPVCGSNMTGRYIKSHRETDSEWQLEESLKHGELIRLQYVPMQYNCFCQICGFNWIGDIKPRFLNLDEIQMEKELRHTREILNQKMEEDREEEKKKKHSIFSPIAKFIGKI